MELIILVSSLFLVALMGYYLMVKIGLFLDENDGCIHGKKQTRLIHLGFDTPYLVEDFICKMEESDQGKHPTMEVIVYAGVKEDMMQMLLSGKLDYVILMGPTKGCDKEKIKCKEILLQPRRLRTDAVDLSIEMADQKAMRVVAFWRPGWINKEKEYFSNLVMKLGE